MDTKPNLSQTRPPMPAKDTQKGITEPSPSRSIEELENEIEKTRRETVQTINELEHRLSFSGIKEKVKDKAQKLTMGKANFMENQTMESTKSWAGAVIDTVRHNPLPTMMIGGGLAWLVANLVGRETQESQYPFDAHYDRRRKDGVDQTGTYGMGFIERRRQTIGGIKEKATGRVEEVKENLREKFQETGRRSADAGGRLREEAFKAGEQIKHKADEISSSAAEYTRRAQDRMTQSGRRAKAGVFHFMENHPLTVAGIVLAAGVVAGLAIPESRMEDRKLGPARDKALDRARELGRQEVEKVKSVAKEAKEAAKEEADRQNLLGREKADQAEAKTAEAIEAAKAKIRQGTDKVKDKF